MTKRGERARRCFKNGFSSSRTPSSQANSQNSFPNPIPGMLPVRIGGERGSMLKLSLPENQGNGSFPRNQWGSFLRRFPCAGIPCLDGGQRAVLTALPGPAIPGPPTAPTPPAGIRQRRLRGSLGRLALPTRVARAHPLVRPGRIAQPLAGEPWPGWRAASVTGQPREQIGSVIQGGRQRTQTRLRPRVGSRRCGSRGGLRPKMTPDSEPWLGPRGETYPR